jgi:hypothetical protein
MVYFEWHPSAAVLAEAASSIESYLATLPPPLCSQIAAVLALAGRRAGDGAQKSE